MVQLHNLAVFLFGCLRYGIPPWLWRKAWWDIQDQIDELLDGRFCSVCDGAFIDRQEKYNAIVSGKSPLTFAHGDCWDKCSD